VKSSTTTRLWNANVTILPQVAGEIAYQGCSRVSDHHNRAHLLLDMVDLALIHEMARNCLDYVRQSTASVAVS